MYESRAALAEWDEIHKLAQNYAAKHSCIKMGAELVCLGEVCFHFKPGQTEREKQEFYGLLKPYDTAGFWDLLPEPTETGWIALSEEMTRRIIDEEARLSFKVGYILFLQDGVLLLEDSPFERKGGTI